MNFALPRQAFRVPVQPVMMCFSPSADENRRLHFERCTGTVRCSHCLVGDSQFSTCFSNFLPPERMNEACVRDWKGK